MNIKLLNHLQILRQKPWVPENCPCGLCKTYIPQIGFSEVHHMIVLEF